MALDWEAIKTEYITTETSQSKLAKKYGVPRSTICKWCAREGWVEQRERYRAGVVQKTIERRAHEDSNQLTKMIDAAEKITGIAVGALDDESKLYTYMVERREKYEIPVGSASGVPWVDGDPDTPVIEKQWVEDRESKVLNTRALKDLSNIVREMTGLIRDFYNIPTPAQIEQKRINDQRLELERMKLNRGEDDDDGETGVVILPEVQEDA